MAELKWDRCRNLKTLLLELDGDGQINMSALPPSLTELGLLGQYNMGLPVIPPTLQRLHLTEYFCDSIGPGELPESLELIHLSGWPETCNDFHLHLPQSTRWLVFDSLTDTLPLELLRHYYSITNPKLFIFVASECQECENCIGDCLGGPDGKFNNQFKPSAPPSVEDGYS
jgi:hypothetical protein